MEELDKAWSQGKKNSGFLSNFEWSKKNDFEDFLSSIPRHGSAMLVQPLDMLQNIPPSQLLTNIVDTSLVTDHVCVQDFDGS